MKFVTKAVYDHKNLQQIFWIRNDSLPPFEVFEKIIQIPDLRHPSSNVAVDADDDVVYRREIFEIINNSHPLLVVFKNIIQILT